MLWLAGLVVVAPRVRNPPWIAFLPVAVLATSVVVAAVPRLLWRRDRID